MSYNVFSVHRSLYTTFVLSIFPEILFLSPFAPLIIRAALAVVLVYDGWYLLSHADARHRVGGICAMIVAGFFLVGASTQPFALLFAISFAIYLFHPYPDNSFSSLPRSTIALAIVMALSLVVTGPGAFAFDLPL